MKSNLKFVTSHVGGKSKKVQKWNCLTYLYNSMCGTIELPHILCFAVPTVKHDGGGVMVWEYFPSAGTGMLVIADERIDVDK